MKKPEFSKQTIDALARRARFQCSNPDCGAHTIGPNSQQEKSTLIGEAAHIFGANPGAARYDEEISITTRSAITNGIWLCRNCHAKIDRDSKMFPSDLLFTWRKNHEERVLRELGSRGDIIRYELEMEKLHYFKHYPKLIHRIAIDKPRGWEWQIGAALLRYLNEKELIRLRNLREGYYFRAHSRITEDKFLGWVTERTHIMSKLLAPFILLFERLIKSFGAPGEPGNLEEINDTCILIRGMLSEIVNHEEKLRFTQIPEEGEEIRSILSDIMGRNIEKIRGLPEMLDKSVALIDTDHGGTSDNPKIITWEATFDIPDGLETRFAKAIEDYSIRSKFCFR